MTEAPSPTPHEIPSAPGEAATLAEAGAGADEDPTTEELLRSLPAPPDHAGPVVGPGETSGQPPARAAERERAAEPESAAEPYALQVGAFGDPDAAGHRAEEVRRLATGIPVDVDRRDGWFKVFLGSFATREEAESTLRELSGRGLGPAWVTRRAR